MDHDEVVVLPTVGILPVRLNPEVAFGDRPVVRMPLEGVVHRLRHTEELIAARDDLPVGVEPKVPHERRHGGEDFGDASAVRRRVDVQHPRTRERSRILANCLDHPWKDNGAVGLEGLRSEFDGSKHGARRLGAPGRPGQTSTAPPVTKESETRGPRCMRPRLARYSAMRTVAPLQRTAAGPGEAS